MPEKSVKEQGFSKWLFLIIISGIMWALAFPPFPLGFLAFFMLIFLWNAIEQVNKWSDAVKLGYIWGLIASFGVLWWIFIPTIPGMIMLVLFLPLYSTLYCLLHYVIARRHPQIAVLVAPILFVGIEFIRSYGKLGFPWMNLSYTMTKYPVLIQFADIVGSFGISFWIVAINVCVYFLLIHPFRWKFWVSGIAMLILLFGAYGYGTYKMRKNIDGAPMKIALLQGNIDPYQKWTAQMRTVNVRTYTRMINSIGSDVDLCILPETATACYYRRSKSMFLPLVNAVCEIGIPTLMGTIDYDDNNRQKYFNSAILVMPDGSYEQKYNKIQLVPFSEYIPLQDRFTSLRKLNFGGSHFTAGDKFTVFHIDGAKFSVLICYESIFGWLAKEFRSRGAHFLVNITNDGWFGETPGPYQHAMFNVMRAIENRCWIARCANTGISMFIDPRGTITRKTQLFQQAILIEEINLTQVETIYHKIGDIFGWGSLVLMPIIVWRWRK
ncbi:apolipoprotein N-acyltransferase [bacterium]|nr:MAG: apolipoprotein N-acyltransferase [bacterium]